MYYAHYTGDSSFLMLATFTLYYYVFEKYKSSWCLVWWMLF